MHLDAAAVTLQVTAVLEALHVPYVIGGSMASTVHGQIRTTMDVDIVADLNPADVALLVQKLGQDFYADVNSIRDAVTHRRSFNLLHLATTFKVDVFVATSRPFDKKQLERRRLQVIAPPDGKAFIASAEDVVLAKLDWYRQGGDVSERQWGGI